MKVAQPGYENNVNTSLSNIKQYYMKVAQPGYENNVNTSLSNIIWK